MFIAHLVEASQKKVWPVAALGDKIIPPPVTMTPLFPTLKEEQN